jgi:hypothetical protein
MTHWRERDRIGEIKRRFALLVFIAVVFIGFGMGVQWALSDHLLYIEVKQLRYRLAHYPSSVVMITPEIQAALDYNASLDVGARERMAKK